jgi:phosphatidyl-myo-inositol dimannoside synthase
MARLLIVTDTTFYRRGGEVLDNFCFDRRFFDDYCAEFDEVRVAARVSDEPPAGPLHRADGDGLAFVDLLPARGVRWTLAPWQRYCRALAGAVAAADALCLRLPGVAGWHAARLAAGRPMMFELIGDPLATALGSPQARIYGLLQHRRTRWILRRCALGSYVSADHLQQRYPAAAGATTAAISSIRLERGWLRPPRSAPWREDRLQLIHVGSFLPVKNQALLVEAMRLARDADLPLSLKLVGDGETRGAIERLVQVHGLGDRIEFSGHLAGPERVMAVMAEADLLVLPSWSEGLPRVALEAMAAGLPVLGSDVPGIRQLLPAWLLFDPASAASLLERCRMLRDGERYRAAATHGSRKVTEFTSDVLAGRRRRLLAELRRLAAMPGRERPTSTEVALAPASAERPG